MFVLFAVRGTLNRDQKHLTNPFRFDVARLCSCTILLLPCYSFLFIPMSDAIAGLYLTIFRCLLISNNFRKNFNHVIIKSVPTLRLFDPSA